MTVPLLSRKPADRAPESIEPAVPDPTTENMRGRLKALSIRGAGAALLGQVCKLLLGLASLSLLARFLDARDFGLLAMVAVLTRFLMQFKDLGLALATIQRKQIDDDQVSALFWVNVGLGALLALVTALLAPAVAWYYGEPSLVGITMVLGALFLLGGLAVQHRALLARRMRLARIAVVEVGALAVGVGAGVGAAVLGAGYWALVVLQVGNALAVTIGLWMACGWRPGRASFSPGVRSMLTFGAHLTAFNTVNFVKRNLDNLLIGKYLGAAVLGLYSVAYRMLLLPVEQINTPLTTVAVPALSQLQDDVEGYRSYYRRAIGLIVTIGMPIVVFMFVAADDVIAVVLGPKWSGVVPIFRTLAPAAMVGTFNVATGWVYVSLGQADRQVRWALVSAIATALAFIVGLRWGALGIAAAYSIVICALRGPSIAYCFHMTPLRFRDLLTELWRPASASVAAGASVALLMPLGLRSRLATLVTCAAIFGIAYVLVWHLIPGGRRRFREMLSLIKYLRAPSLWAGGGAPATRG